MDAEAFLAVLTGAHPLATWRAAGVTRHELVHDLGRRVHHGRWSFVGTSGQDPLARALADASVVPDDGALGGWGAAQVLGVHWLDGTTRAGDPQPGVLCLPRHRQVRRRSIVTLRSRLDPGDVVRVTASGVRVTSPARTAFDLGRTAPDLATAVERLDCLLTYGISPGDVVAYAGQRERWAGVARVRRAVGLATARIRSPGESRLRMLWVLDARLPQPMVNATVLDLQGRVQAEVDLLDPRTGLVGEYDGAPHSGAARRSKDAQRQERLERLGLTVVRCTAIDVHEVKATVGRLKSAASTAERAGRGPRRWTAHELSVPGYDLRRYVVE